MSVLDFLDNVQGQALRGELEGGGCTWSIDRGEANLLGLLEKMTKNGKDIIEVTLESSEGIATFALMVPTASQSSFVQRKNIERLMGVVLGAVGKKPTEIALSAAIKKINEVGKQIKVMYSLERYNSLNQQTGESKAGVNLESLQFISMLDKQLTVKASGNEMKDDNSNDVPF
jgi:hypothetical protein